MITGACVSPALRTAALTLVVIATLLATGPLRISHAQAAPVAPSAASRTVGAQGASTLSRPETLVPAVAPSARPAKGRLIVGDSLTVSVSPALRADGFQVNGQVGRQFAAALSIVRSDRRRLPRNLVVALGTNGAISLSTCRAVVKAAGRDRRVFLVTNHMQRAWQSRNNKVLRSCNRAFKAGRVRMIDWHAASRGRPHLAGDGVHLSAAGRARFAALIDRAVDKHGR